MTAPRRALIIGGSHAGLFCANLLLRAGWQVDVYERSGEELAGRGAGIVTHPELREALLRAGARVDETLGVASLGRLTIGQDGKLLGKVALPQILTAWGRIYHMLKDALPAGRCHFGRTLERIEQDGGSVSAIFADGQRETGDLLVAADGIRSTVRRQYAPQVKPVYGGYVAWRGLTDERLLSRATYEALADYLGFCLTPREQMLGYLVAGDDNEVSAGARRYNFVWYRPTDAAGKLRELLTDRAGRPHEITISPDLIRDEVVDEMRRDAERLLAPQFAEVVRLSERPFFQAIFDLESTRLAFGRVVLVGDAAFIARPHCGMGVTKAAGDAVALVDALAAAPTIEHGLAAYEAKRVAFGHAIVAHARELGAFLQAQSGSEAERVAAARHHDPEILMREVAVPPQF
ncbi:MAG: FAD binding domain-containing protein [Betaproteobacteria bacterium]|nr:FAD binding domain-containing protein [Betaproteobacteria bacterium]